MNIASRSFFALLFCASAVACSAAPEADLDSDGEGTTAEEALRAGITPGVFTFYAEPDHQKTGCDLYTRLEIKKAANGSSAALTNGVDGVCALAVMPDLRTFRLKNESNQQSCGLKVYTGSKKTPQGRRSIRITDYRSATCALGAAPLVLDETLADGTVVTRYSARDPESPCNLVDCAPGKTCEVENGQAVCVDPSPAPCVKTGCSGQICADQHMASTCEFRPEYACYQQAICERNANGQCGWRQTAQLTSCLASH